MKNAGNQEGYVPFDMDENEHKLMALVTIASNYFVPETKFMTKKA